MRLVAILFALFLATPASAQIVNTLPFQLQNGTTADATQVMADFNQIVNNANSNAAKNGANSDITSLSGLTTPLSPAQGGSSVYTGGTSSGTNAQVVSSSPNGFTLVAGKRIVFIAGGTNTGATTLAVSGTTATNVYYPTPNGPLPLVGGEIKTGNIIEAWFDGTQFQLITNNLALLGPLTSIASATTTDLGTVATHNVNITGNTTITSFGATASVAYPIYYLTFSGVTTLTYNQTTCSTVGNCIGLPGSANITTAAGDTAVAQYLGAGSGGGGNWVIGSYQRASGATVVATTPLCGATNWLAKNTSGTENTNIDYSADTAVMVNPSGVSITATSPSGTINTTNVGVINGVQATRVLNTWYNLYLLSNGTTTGGFAVASGSALSAPAGYVYSCRLGAIQTDGSANFYRTRLRGKDGQLVVTSATNTVQSALVIASGNTSSTPSVLGFVPPTSTRIRGYLSGNVGASGTGVVQVSPNNSYAPFYVVLSQQPGAGGSAISSMPYDFLLEGTTIAYNGSYAGATAYVSGWSDAVNAN